MCCKHWRLREANKFHVLPLVSGEEAALYILTLVVFAINDFLEGVSKNKRDCRQYRIIGFQKICELRSSIR